MKDVNDCKDMLDIRDAIDSIDNDIVRLISQRSQYVHAAAKFKKSDVEVKDKDRVSKVINSKKKLADKYGVSSVLVEKIYKMMIDFFISEEMKEWSNLSK